MYIYNKYRVYLCVLILIIFASCAGNKSDVLPKVYKKSSSMMDTIVEIQIVNVQQNQDLDTIVNNCFSVMDNWAKRLALNDENNILTEINRSDNRVTTIENKVLFQLIEKSHFISKETFGNFDLTVFPLTKLYDFMGNVSIPTQDEIDIALTRVGFNKMQVLTDTRQIKFDVNNMGLDLNGVSQGFIADMAIEELKKNGITDALVNASGEISILGYRDPIKKKPWLIGIQNPRGNGFFISFELEDECVATSGDYERYFDINNKRYHHIIDPKTGLSSDKCVSATVIAPTALEADGYSTAAFVAGKAFLSIAKNLKLKALLVLNDGKIIHTDDFPADNIPETLKW